MINRLSHVTIYVTNQDTAYDFYVGKLGFDVATDATMENGFRWLTVSPKGQPDIEIVLMNVEDPTEPEKTATLKKALAGGMLGTGVFETVDALATYAELSAKGVEFAGEPVEQFYGIEMILKDPFGNWFSVTQRKDH